MACCVCALLLLVGQMSDSEGAQLVAYAKAVIVAQVVGGKTPPLKVDGKSKPVFVTIERKGKILGCRGTLVARKTTLREEIAACAQSAAAHDPRYRPLQKNDLEGILVTVTIVNRIEPMSNVANLKPDDGLVLTSGNQQGVVLPWEGKDPAIRLKWAYQKAGVPVGSAAKLQRLIGERWRG